MRRTLLLALICFQVALIYADQPPADTPRYAIESPGTYPEEGSVLYFKLDSDIHPTATRITKRALDHAKEKDVDVILMELNTFGGMLDDAENIRNAILNSPIPIVVFINSNAASAGALISIACQSIYMSSGATIGAATVVNQSGQDLPDKYQSYMRAMMRATAEKTGRDPLIAEAMVDPNREIEGVTTEGEVITFTRSEAKANNYCEGDAERWEDVLEAEGIDHYEVIEMETTTLDRVINFLLNPMVSSILILVIMAGMYFELQTAGLGFPAMAALLAAVLYFAPLYLEQLATFWDIALFVVGVLLLAIEVFTLAGFGIVGVLGFMCMFTGLMFALIHNDFFDFTMAGSDAIIEAFITVMGAFLVAIVLVFVTGASLFKTEFFKRLVLSTRLDSKNAYESVTEHQPDLQGKTGIVITPLHPAGKVRIEGEQYDAISEGRTVDKGAKVVVIEDHKTRIVVRKAQ